MTILTEDEFIQRFTGHLVKMVGETDVNGESVSEYGQEMGPIYYKEHYIPDQGDLTPEDWADADLDCWESADG